MVILHDIAQGFFFWAMILHGMCLFSFTFLISNIFFKKKYKLKNDVYFKNNGMFLSKKKKEQFHVI